MTFREALEVPPEMTQEGLAAAAWVEERRGNNEEPIYHLSGQVHPHHRRRGLGTRLLDEATSIANQKGFHRLAVIAAVGVAAIIVSRLLFRAVPGGR